MLTHGAQRYINELEQRLRMACEPCADCGHIDYRELDDVLDREGVTRYSAPPSRHVGACKSSDAVGGGDSPGDLTVQPAPSNIADELREALDDPKRGEWGGYPWEHLGDAERDVRVLLAELAAARAEAERLRADKVLLAKQVVRERLEDDEFEQMMAVARAALAEAAPEETP